MQYPTAVLLNTQTKRYHPISFQEYPHPADTATHRRYKSIGHHTEGFDTEELATKWITDNKDRCDPMNQLFEWDGTTEGAAMVSFLTLGKPESSTPERTDMKPAEDTRVLTAAKVDAIMRDCLYKEDELKDIKQGELPAGCVTVVGLVNKYGFHPQRLESHREEIRTLLDELPNKFKAGPKEQGYGGGSSFLEGCVDKHDMQWGEHRDMESLFCLGMALKYVACPLPKDVWHVLPGGMPYYCVDLNRENPAHAVKEEIPPLPEPEPNADAPHSMQKG